MPVRRPPRRLMICSIKQWPRSTEVIGSTGTALAERVIAADGVNADAEDLLTAPADRGEIRRMTIVFADLVDSTGLSTRVEPETYRMLVGRYREQVYSTINQLEGHVGSQQGDGLLAVFGHPTAHEDDARRAVLAGLEITRRGRPPQRAGTAPIWGRYQSAGWRTSRAGVFGHHQRRRVRVGRQRGRPGVEPGAAGSVVSPTRWSRWCEHASSCRPARRLRSKALRD